MHSLLSKEIKNYNNLGKNKESYIYEKSIILDNKIPESSTIHNDANKNEKSLNIHIFNPLKNSPPNEWQFRLLGRINSLNDMYVIKD